MPKQIYTVIIEKDEEAGLHVADVPGLLACHTQGKTIDELMENVQEAIELSLDVQKELPQLPKFVGIQQVEVTA